MRYQINRLGSRPYEFHPVNYVGWFESEEAAQPVIERLEAKSAKRNKWGPTQYAALPRRAPGQSQKSFDQEFQAMVEESRKNLD
jgi:hypothetical protein